MYEGEINMVIHAEGGKITVEISPEQIRMILADKGPGIPNVEPRLKHHQIPLSCHLQNGLVRLFASDKDNAHNIQHLRRPDNLRIV